MRRISILVVLAIVVCFAFSACPMQAGTENDDIVKYTMYIGLNDKDTYTQLISYEEAEKKVSGIVLKYVDGFTVLSAKGAYKDDKGVITNENSLVLHLLCVTEEQVRLIMDEVLKELNQNSILLERQVVNCEFYEGVKP